MVPPLSVGRGTMEGMTIAEAPPRLAAAADVSLRWYPEAPYSLSRTLGPLLRGNSDPSFCVQGDVIWNAFTAPTGPATLRLAPAGGEAGGPLHHRRGRAAALPGLPAS